MLHTFKSLLSSLGGGSQKLIPFVLFLRIVMYAYEFKMADIYKMADKYKMVDKYKMADKCKMADKTIFFFNLKFLQKKMFLFTKNTTLTFHQMEK
jgi:hypothetical protein